MNSHDHLDNFVRRGIDAQRAVDRVVEKNNSSVSPATPRENLPANRTLKKRKLRNSVDVHWRTDDDGYEHILRTVFDRYGNTKLGEAERKRWFGRGWRERLEKQRAAHRKAGEPDAQFLPPSKRK